MQEDHVSLRAILDEPDTFEIEEATTYRGALRRVDDVRVVISETNLPDGGWKDVFEYLSFLPDPPLLIVTSRFADDRLWAEVLNLGGYDVLLKPFDTREVYRVVTGAILSSEREIIARRDSSSFRKPMVRAAGAASFGSGKRSSDACVHRII